MKIEQIPLQDITFTYTPYPTTLYDSLKRIGQNFAIRVDVEGSTYCCVDGHKRLSAIQDILRDDPNCQRFTTIQVIRTTARTQAPYTLHNHH